MRSLILIFVIFIINKCPLCACSADYDYITYSNGAYDTDFEKVLSDNDAVKVIQVPQVSYQEEEIKVPVVSYDTEALIVPSETQGIKIYPDNSYDADCSFDEYSIPPIGFPFEETKSQIVVNSLESSYIVERITTVNGTLLQNPQWSSEENVLYWTDKWEQIIYRYSPKENALSSRYIHYGPTPLVFPVKDEPGIILVAVRNELFLLRWDAPGDDLALRQVAVVDIGHPDNIICGGKIDAKGRLWFGTQGRSLGGVAAFVADASTFYSISYENLQNPDIIVRPVTEITGVTWSIDNKKIFFNDGPTRKILQYDFILDTGVIGNRSVFFDFDDKNISGFPEGLTLDEDGNIWAATINGSRILKIDSKTGKLIDEIVLPVDQVTSLTWGGKDFRTLYVTTGRRFVENPMPMSGSLFAITNTGTRGILNYGFKFPNAGAY